jgi:hypothetical protein
MNFRIAYLPDTNDMLLKFAFSDGEAMDLSMTIAEFARLVEQMTDALAVVQNHDTRRN